MDPSDRVSIRFYAELCDLVEEPSGRLEPLVGSRRSVKDLIEACGVPHTEVDLVLVDGKSVPFSHPITGGERIAVYPVFEAFDVAPVTEVRPDPLRETKFVLDVHLGRLARYLRLLGFDTDYEPDRDDDRLVTVSVDEGRILLTRDRELLQRASISHGAFVRATDPIRQLREVVQRFHLSRSIAPFSRCMVCNGELEPVDADLVSDQVPPMTRRHVDEYRRCRSCGRVFWRGAHHEGLMGLIDAATSSPTGPMGSDR